MRLLALDGEPSSKRGGQEISLKDLLTFFSQNNNITIYLGFSKYGDFIQTYKEHGIIPVKMGNFLFKKKSPIAWFLFLKSIYKIKKINPKFVYINQIGDIPAPAIAKSMFKMKFRLTCHLRLPPPTKGIFQKRNQIGIILDNVDQFIVASETMKDGWSQSGIPLNKILVIPNAFLFSENGDSTKRVIRQKRVCYLGRIVKEKGIDILILAFSEAAKLDKEFELHIGGKIGGDAKEYFQYLKNLTKSLEIEDRVIFHGHIENPHEFLSQYDLCVFPSVVEESFGRVIVESIMAGTPIIANDVGSIREVMGNSGRNWIYSNYAELENFLIHWQHLRHDYPLIEMQTTMRTLYDINFIAPKVFSVITGGMVK